MPVLTTHSRKFLPPSIPVQLHVNVNCKYPLLFVDVILRIFTKGVCNLWNTTKSVKDEGDVENENKNFQIIVKIFLSFVKEYVAFTGIA